MEINEEALNDLAKTISFLRKTFKHQTPGEGYYKDSIRTHLPELDQSDGNVLFDRTLIMAKNKDGIITIGVMVAEITDEGWNVWSTEMIDS